MNENPNLNNLNDIPTIDIPQPVQEPTPVAEQNSIPVAPSASENTIAPVPQDLQAIPNVEQTNEQFISNTQSAVKKEESHKGNDNISLIFLLIIFALILGIVIYVFPMLLNK